MQLRKRNKQEEETLKPLGYSERSQAKANKGHGNGDLTKKCDHPLISGAVIAMVVIVIALIVRFSIIQASSDRDQHTGIILKGSAYRDRDDGNNFKVLTTAIWLGTESTGMTSTCNSMPLRCQYPRHYPNDHNNHWYIGHHLWYEIWEKMSSIDDHIVKPTYIMEIAKVPNWLANLNSTTISDHTWKGIGIDSHPTGALDTYPNFTKYVERFEEFNSNNMQFGIQLKIRSVVMRRDLVSTVASGIRRGFPNVHTRPLWQWRGMKLLEQQVRSVPQDYWIMIDYEDFCLRPLMYAPILAEWFHVDNATLFEYGLQAVHIRDPKKDIVKESWERIRKWDAEHVGNSTNGYTMEFLVQEARKMWQEDVDSIWNNECVLVSPENPAFVKEGSICF